LALLEGESERIRCFNVALGSRNTRSRFFLNDFPYASSMLPMTDHLRDVFPHASCAQEVVVDCWRLDSLQGIDIKAPALMKVDVQGAELDVLNGCGNLLNQVGALQLEVNFEPFYECQTSVVELIGFLTDKGFTSFIQQNTYLSETNPRRVLFCDLLFLRNHL
jgi:FkbM family methyltransferase